MSQPDERRELLDKIERRLPDRSIREVAMFGAVAVMVDDAMLVAVNKDHSLLVRILPDEDPQLLSRAEASRAEMGAGRSMGTGWIQVDSAALDDGATLDLWLHHALRRHEFGRKAAP